jgi:hypothetical protein
MSVMIAMLLQKTKKMQECLKEKNKRNISITYACQKAIRIQSRRRLCMRGRVSTTTLLFRGTVSQSADLRTAVDEYYRIRRSDLDIVKNLLRSTVVVRNRAGQNSTKEYLQGTTYT